MSYSHSQEQKKQNGDKPKVDEIKKGLERIKQAQIEVLRELRKDDTQNSRNYSLTYSKQSTLDSKPIFKFQPEKILTKQRMQKFQSNAKQLTNNHNKLRDDYLDMKDQARKNKDGWQKAEIKMKQYQKGEERALAQAQQALCNAIESQKKYLSVKSENNKLIKDREKLVTDLKKMQRKEIAELIAGVETEHNIPNKIIKQLNSINDYFGDILRLVHTHKCRQEQGMSPRSVSSSSSFIISTFEIQSKIDRAINSIILYFHQVQNYAFIHNKSLKMENVGDGSQSGKGDGRKGEEEKSKEKINRKNRVEEKQDKQVMNCYQEIKILKNKNKYLAKEIENVKRSKLILEQQYDKYKIKMKLSEAKKQKQYDMLRKKQKLLQQSEQINSSQSRSKKQKQNPQTLSQRNIQILQDRIVDLQKENIGHGEKIKKYEVNERQLSNIIEKLKNQVEFANTAKQQLQNQCNYQINKLNTKINILEMTNNKNIVEREQLLQTMRRMQQQRNQSIQKYKQIQKQFEKQTMKYEADVKDLQLAVKILSEEIEQLRKENASIMIDKTELQRLRNLQKIQINQTDLMNKKQKDYTTVSIMGFDGQFQQNSSTSVFQEQTPRKSFDPSQRIFFANPNTHSLMRLNVGQTSIKQINNSNHQTQLINSYPSMPLQIQIPSMAILPQTNANIVYHHPIQYQPCYVLPQRISCQQNIIQK